MSNVLLLQSKYLSVRLWNGQSINIVTQPDEKHDVSCYRVPHFWRVFGSEHAKSEVCGNRIQFRQDWNLPG